MKKTIVTLSAVLSLTTLCSLFSLTVYAESMPLTPVFENKMADLDIDADIVENKLIVMTKPDADKAEIESEVDAEEVFIIFEDDAYDIYAVDLDDSADLYESMTILASSDDVLYVEPDYKVESCSVSDDPFVDKDTDQWQHQAIHTFEAWDLIDKLPSHGKTRVAVLDTNANLFHDELTSVVNTSLSCDFTEAKKKSIDTSEFHYHGTHVAGIIGASSVDGNKCYGVANGTNNDCVELVLITVNTADMNAGLSGIIAAIDYASKNGCKVANMSFGTTNLKGNEKALESAIDTALDRGMVCVCSAGNLGSSTMQYPSSFENTVAVGALNVTNGKLAPADYSSYGKVDISAPGTGIWSLEPNQSGHQMFSGTSMASPVVTGVISLVLAADSSLSAKEAAQIVLDTAVDLGDSKTGAGCVNAYAAVRKAISIRNSNYLPPENSSLYNAPVFGSNHPDPDFNTEWSIRAYVGRCYNAIKIEDLTLVNYEYSYYMNHDLTVCDYLNRFYTSEEFCDYTNRITDKEFIKVIYLSVLARVPSEREYKIGLNYLKNNERMAFVSRFLKQSSTWIEFCDNSLLSFGNPYDYYVWNR